MRRAYILIVFAALLGVAALYSRTYSSSYRVVHGWPQLPEGFAFGQVTGVQVDSKNQVHVFHRGSKPIMVFDAPTGKLLRSWGDGTFGSAHGLTLDSKDNVWVTDIVHHQIFKYSPTGQLLLTVGEKDKPGVDKTHFNKPTDLAVAPNGAVYVSDGYGNSRIVKLSADGKFQAEWGTKGDQPGQFDTPHGITLDKQGRVYVADRGNSRIQVFSADGKFLKQWKSEDLGRPWGLSIGLDNFLYVADGGDLHKEPPERNYALKLDLDGKILEKWGSFGSYDGQFYWAHDIAPGKNGDVYVCDVYLGMRVQRFVKQ